ncbi:serine O-acetyltransferase [Motilibacter rhizosphaerae]|uniref:Serine O-acetyltransferase n=1 Tax=Motilibacter rhizosphaerae TaxID=598652 RepID=A0A4Q7NPW5_9ACTN|nr:serine acetyltransferase [Motilibacter rhizosphaerae]RZS87365.1 serine O-acetyltransferase [Motilibacter rhizosphaerae]
MTTADAVALLRADLAAYREDADRPPRTAIDQVVRVVLLQRLQAVALFRLAQFVFPRSAVLAYLIKAVNVALTGADVSHEAAVGPGLQLYHPTGVVIGPRARIGSRCRIMAGVVFGHGRGGSPRVGDDVFIGSHAVLVGGISVGDRASIGAQAVVTVDVPAGGAARAPRSEIKGPREPAVLDLDKVAQ